MALAPQKPKLKQVFTIDAREMQKTFQFVTILQTLLEKIREGHNQLVILCMGSDRSTGDALGPLVGSYLIKLGTKNAIIRGTLFEPVHALNLQQNLDDITKKYDSPAILAIDASLGKEKEIGFLKIGEGALYPGAAIQKKLPPVGDIFITGIVNIGGFMEFMVLQSTRLSVVLPLARFIAWGIFKTLSQVKWPSDDYLMNKHHKRC